MIDSPLTRVATRDEEVQAVVLRLVEAYAFQEAAVVLNTRLEEIADNKRTHIEDVFAQWSLLTPEDRPDFLTFAHHRRNPELTGPGAQDAKA